MSDHYGVTPTDIAGELPGLFPDLFTPSTKPNEDQVAAIIAREDAIAYVVSKWARVIDDDPDFVDAVAALCTEYVIAATKWRVLEIVYAGVDPIAYANIVGPARTAALGYLQAIRDLERAHTAAEEAASGGAGAAVPPSMATPNRYTW